MQLFLRYFVSKSHGMFLFVYAFLIAKGLTDTNKKIKFLNLPKK